MKPLEVGDLVYLSTKNIKLQIPNRKLGPKYIGPFPVARVINPITVKLTLPPLLGKIYPVFHSSLLKPVTTLRNKTQWPAPLADGHYKINEILDSRIHRGRLQYMVHWKEYPYEEVSWLPVGNLKAARVLCRFHKRYPWKPGPNP